MIRWLRSVFAWKEVRRTGVWSYQINGVTGDRLAVRVMFDCFSPIDWDWLRAGERHEVFDPSGRIQPRR